MGIIFRLPKNINIVSVLNLSQPPFLKGRRRIASGPLKKLQFKFSYINLPPSELDFPYKSPFEKGGFRGISN